MATTKNKNLFYQLYSHPNDVANSGYVCQAAVDENDTSFDIIGSEGQITDSNGDVLASIDMSSIHAAGLTEYNVETKLLQPKSAYLLQGNEYGETYKSQFFVIYKKISNVIGYENYCNLQFDILYKQKNKICNIHVNTKKVRLNPGSFVNIVQAQLNKLKVPITITIRTLDDPDSSESTIDYINFQSTQQGYDFIVRNVIITPIMSDEANCNGDISIFIDSPFFSTDITADMILELIEKYKPQIIGEHTSYDDYQYKICCGVYKAFLKLANNIGEDLNTFFYELDILYKYFLPCFNIDGIIINQEKLDMLIQQYNEIYIKYFDGLLAGYNIYDIFKILQEIKNYVLQVININGPSYCFEDFNKRILNVKYPNGAMRGIVIIPDWPNDTDYDYSVLWVNHIADQVEICVPVNIQSLQKYYGGDILRNKNAILYEKALATVKINALIPEEREQYIEDYDNLPLNDISSNDGFTTSFDKLQVAGFDTNDFVDNDFHRVPLSLNSSNPNDISYHQEDIFITDQKNNDNIWETNPNKGLPKFVDTHKALSNKVIGLYKYMEYLSTNDLWLKIGDGYMLIGKDDNLQSNTKNLLQSVLIYNPNDVPIRIKYMILS